MTFQCFKFIGSLVAHTASCEMQRLYFSLSRPLFDIDFSLSYNKTV